MKKQRITSSQIFGRAVVAQELDEKNEIIAQLKAQIEELKRHHSSSSQTVLEMPIEKVVPLRLPKGMSQPRYYFNEDALQRLADSIKKIGIAEPLLLRPSSDGLFEVMGGERRYRAAKIANLEKVPYTLKELSDADALELAIIDNLFREDLNPFEKTDSMVNLIALKLTLPPTEVPSLLYKMKNAKERGIENNVILNQKKTVQELFKPFDMALDSFVANMLPLLNLPQHFLDVLRNGQIEPSKARVIAKLDSNEQQQTLLQEVIDSGLSLSGIKSRIQEISSAQNKSKDAYLRERIGMATKKMKRVSILENPKNQKKLQQILELIESLEGS